MGWFFNVMERNLKQVLLEVAKRHTTKDSGEGRERRRRRKKNEEEAQPSNNKDKEREKTNKIQFKFMFHWAIRRKSILVKEKSLICHW
jgi:hypothetical protein